MKTRLFILLATLCFAVSSPAETINKIVFSRSLCGPVMLKDATGGWISVTDGETFRGEYNFIRGYDCQCRGVSVVCHKSDRNKSDFIRTWFVGESVLPYLNDSYHDCPNNKYNSSGSNSGSYKSSSSSTGSSSSAQAGARLGQNITRAIAAGGGSGESRFGLAAVPGISRCWGENLDFRLRLGSTRIGYAMSGGLGTDWINGTDKILWSTSIGVYFGNMPKEDYLWEVAGDIKFGRSCMTKPSSYTLMFDVSTMHVFGDYQIFGVTAAAGLGIANLQTQLGSFAWDLSVGVVIFFLQADWF